MNILNEPTQGLIVPTKICYLSHGHTIVTTSRRPLTTTFFGWLLEVVRVRQMFVDDSRPVGDWLSENYIDNLSPTSDNHFFWVVFGRFRWSANDCRWSPTSRRLVVRTVWSARGIRCSIENQTSRRHFCKHSLVGDRSPINRRSVADQSSVVAHNCFWLVTIRRLQNGMRLPLDWA